MRSKGFYNSTMCLMDSELICVCSFVFCKLSRSAVFSAVYLQSHYSATLSIHNEAISDKYSDIRYCQ